MTASSSTGQPARFLPLEQADFSAWNTRAT